MGDVRLVMGMPVEVRVVGGSETATLREEAFARFAEVDARFSTYKPESEISRINRGELTPEAASSEMREVFAIAEATRRATAGYFDIRRPDGALDPSGIVKGWAIRDVATRLRALGCTDFFVNAGGDIASAGANEEGRPWSVGIRNPFAPDGIVKVIYPKGAGIATSGSYLRGAHIYDPHRPGQPIEKIVSLTVIGPDVLEADRFATAAFAMGEGSIAFIESVPGLEGYAIMDDGVATMTSGLTRYLSP